MAKANHDSLIRKLARVEVAASAPVEAAATYQKNFGFRIRRAENGDGIVEVGQVEIRLIPAGARREGLIALQFETEQLDNLTAALSRAGIEVARITTADGARAIEIPPRVTGNVPVIVLQRQP